GIDSPTCPKAPARPRIGQLERIAGAAATTSKPIGVSRGHAILEVESPSFVSSGNCRGSESAQTEHNRAKHASKCWCGNTDLRPFSPDYLRCPVCETLVLARMPDPESLRVVDDNRDFYGRQYYESWLTDQYGYPNLTDRARTDLPERCLHWLRVLLKY